MGILVASTLVKAGYRVVAYDVNPHALQRAQDLGAVPVGHPQNVAEQTETILLVLPGPPQVEAVVTGDHGLLARAQSGQVIVDMSTVDPATTRRMGARAEEVGVPYLDAPILGRPSALGRWVLPVGGDSAIVARCRPLLEVLARKVIHVGPLGAGNTLKLLNALMFSAINAMTAEMMAISMKAGLSPKVLFETIAASQAATVSGLFKEVGSKIIARDFTPIFPIDLLCKDNRLAIAMARACDAPPVLANTVQVLNELASARGLGAEDTSALVKVYEALLDVEWDDSQE
ncbi:MAG: NAD(P)-dependent oxidoreductase [Chloroflexi bacterium]|nr:NAD(P)-dependent oxidoreductase [Chloroflexota bacterium]